MADIASIFALEQAPSPDYGGATESGLKLGMMFGQALVGAPKKPRRVEEQTPEEIESDLIRLMLLRHQLARIPDADRAASQDQQLKDFAIKAATREEAAAAEPWQVVGDVARDSMAYRILGPSHIIRKGDETAFGTFDANGALVPFTMPGSQMLDFLKPVPGGVDSQSVNEMSDFLRGTAVTMLAVDSADPELRNAAEVLINNASKVAPYIAQQVLEGHPEVASAYRLSLQEQRDALLFPGRRMQDMIDKSNASVTAGLRAEFENDAKHLAEWGEIAEAEYKKATVEYEQATSELDRELLILADMTEEVGFMGNYLPWGERKLSQSQIDNSSRVVALRAQIKRLSDKRDQIQQRMTLNRAQQNLSLRMAANVFQVGGIQSLSELKDAAPMKFVELQSLVMQQWTYQTGTSVPGLADPMTGAVANPLTPENRKEYNQFLEAILYGKLHYVP